MKSLFTQINIQKLELESIILDKIKQLIALYIGK